MLEAIGAGVAAAKLHQATTPDDHVDDLSLLSLRRIEGLLRQIAANTEPSAPSHARIERTIIVQTYPGMYRLSREGRLHVMMYAAAQFTMYAEIPGVGTNPAITIGAGWNILDLPDGTQISVPTGATAVNALIRLDDEAIGVAI